MLYETADLFFQTEDIVIEEGMRRVEALSNRDMKSAQRDEKSHPAREILSLLRKDMGHTGPRAGM